MDPTMSVPLAPGPASTETSTTDLSLDTNSASALAAAMPGSSVAVVLPIGTVLTPPMANTPCAELEFETTYSCSAAYTTARRSFSPKPNTAVFVYVSALT